MNENFLSLAARRARGQQLGTPRDMSAYSKRASRLAAQVNHAKARLVRRKSHPLPPRRATLAANDRRLPQRARDHHTSRDVAAMLGFAPSVLADMLDPPEKRQALVDAIVDRDGMLAIGRLNPLEFMRVADSALVRAAEELLQAVLPRVFFLDVQILDIVIRETARLRDVQVFDYFGAPLLGEWQEWRAASLFDRLSDRKVEFRQDYQKTERGVLSTLNEYSDVDARMMRDGLSEAAARPNATLGIARWYGKSFVTRFVR